MSMRVDRDNKIVLVCVLKNKRDLEILLNEQWYRIPVKHLPKSKFEYLAFYQPLGFGKKGKRIIYFARVAGLAIMRRIELLPDEPDHPRAGENYARFRVGKVKRLFIPIINTVPRRVNFGFTTLNRLLNSKNILELYSIAPIEQILEKALKKEGIKYKAQQYAVCGKKRFRLDFAIYRKKGKIAIECDNKKAHSYPLQIEKDKNKSKTLTSFGWTVIRLAENDIIFNKDECVGKIKTTVNSNGGLHKLTKLQHKRGNKTVKKIDNKQKSP